jgi:arylsulfatase A-like enzyme
VRVRILLLAIAIGPVACAPEPEAPAASRPPERPDVLLISVDTLRSDRVSSYGHERLTTPFIDGLAAEGVRFQRAYSTTSWTAPALASMLTSAYPIRHGVGQGVRGRAWEAIPVDLPTVAELFRDHGYRTYGLTANFGLPAERGFGRGFDRYECVGAVDLEVVRETFSSWLPDLQAGSPWLFWLHLFDPHAPYLARGRWLDTVEPVPTERFPDLDALPAHKLPSIARELDPPRLDYLRALYDSEVRAVDDFVREIFERLPRARNALVVVVADHGEEFLEHGGVLHGRTVFEEVVRIPFIVRFPDRRLAGTVSGGPVSLIDVLPTLAAAASIPIPSQVAGTNLFRDRGVHETAERPIVAELIRGGDIRAWIEGRWKYIAPVQRPEGGSLFDLESDPGEATNLAASHPDLVLGFAERLASFVVAHTPSTPPAVTPATEEQVDALRDLGYMR